MNGGLLDIGKDFIGLFFPNYCFGCNRSLVKGEDTLCTICLIDLPKTNYHLLIDNPIKGRLNGRLPIDHALAYLKFRKSGIVQHLLHQLKYNNHPEVGVKLGLTYGRELEQVGFQNEFDVIIPIPLHPTRLRKRGYNQSAKFAEGLSHSLRIPWAESISIRKTTTSTQTKKSKQERWENVEGAFGIQSAEKIVGQRILLVDDVVTTGATLEACGQHLIKNRCGSLSIACIAEAQ
ncbi:MAG: ComF family protein [Flammeovirgaceae bacterium]|jgi:ComF family protein|nr:ComF family protein [Flammeovirgaceae bacterium]